MKGGVGLASYLFDNGSMGDDQGLEGVNQNIISLGATFTIH